MTSRISGNFKTQDMCEKAVEKFPYQLENVPDHFKTQSMCEKAIEKASWLLIYVPDLRPKQYVKRPLKKTQISWKMSQIILKHNQCVKRPLKMNQKPYNLFQIVLKPKRYVKESSKNSHEPWKMSLITLKHKKCVKESLKGVMVVYICSWSSKPQEMCNKAVEESPFLLKHIPDNLKDSGGVLTRQPTEYHGIWAMSLIGL